MASNSGSFTFRLDPVSYSDVQNKLRQLTLIEQEAALKKGLSEAAGILESAGRRNLKKSSRIHSPRLKGKKKQGKPLINSFSRKVNVKQSAGYAGFKRPDGAAAHLLDRGTKDRYTKKGFYRGRITKDLFYTDAVQANGDKALQTLCDSIELSINRILNRK